MRVDIKQREKVVTYVKNKLSELNIDIIDDGNLDRNHLNGKGLHLSGKGILLYAKKLIDGIWNYDARKKCLKNVSVIIAKYREKISVMLTLAVP